MSNDDALWSIDDIARYLGVARSSVNRWRERDAGFPPAIRLSARAIRFDPDEVKAWVQSHRAGARRANSGGRPPKPVKA